jgi:hypothetical protein
MPGLHALREGVFRTPARVREAPHTRGPVIPGRLDGAPATEGAYGDGFANDATVRHGEKSNGDSFRREFEFRFVGAPLWLRHVGPAAQLNVRGVSLTE